MEFTTSTKCQCLPPDFTPPGNGCRQPDKCLGPGAAGIGDYCEGCSDSRCRRHAMEAVQKARDLSWRHKTSRRKCKCAHDNIIGCDSPAHCSGFGCGAQGFCQACESSSCITQYINTSIYFKQISRVTRRYISTERAVKRPPTSARSKPASAPTYQQAMQTEQLHSKPSTSHQQPSLPTTDHARQPDNLYSNPNPISRRPAPPIVDHAEQAAQPYGNGNPSTSYPQPQAAPPTTTAKQIEQSTLVQPSDTVLPPALEAEGYQATYTNTHNTNTNTASPFPASSSNDTDMGFNQRRCVCQGTWTCKAGGMCEETILFLEGDFCGMCEIFDCAKWEA